jgi:D-3-phosphoglycerate dehydrogenase / 2-oxoglutarate reductase
MRVIAHDPYMAPDDVVAHGASPVSFGDLIEHADYLVIQAPLTKETHHRIGEAELRRMKRTLILVNTARGPIVNDNALYLALKEGWIAGAGLDDIEEEPAKQRDWKPVNPLFGLDNVVITPHAAYYSEEAIRTVRDFAAHEVARVLTGQPPLSPVNAAQLAVKSNLRLSSQPPGVPGCLLARLQTCLDPGGDRTSRAGGGCRCRADMSR